MAIMLYSALISIFLTLNLVCKVIYVSELYLAVPFEIEIDRKVLVMRVDNLKETK